MELMLFLKFSSAENRIFRVLPMFGKIIQKICNQYSISGKSFLHSLTRNVWETIKAKNNVYSTNPSIISSLS